MVPAPRLPWRQGIRRPGGPITTLPLLLLLQVALLCKEAKFYKRTVCETKRHYAGFATQRGLAKVMTRTLRGKFASTAGTSGSSSHGADGDETSRGRRAGATV